MESDPERIKDYLDLQFIARALERAGDYSKNICEDAIFVESAVVEVDDLSDDVKTSDPPTYWRNEVRLSNDFTTKELDMPHLTL